MKFAALFILFIGTVCAKDWWENGNFYQIYPRSFMDSNDDGIGDLNGITEKLEFLKDIGMTGAWLSPIFDSPMVDFGYDISDYYKIFRDFGTNEDLKKLIEKAHEIGLRVILDFVPNHTSDEHEWFKKSVKREGIYEDFYVWEDGIRNESGRFPPNNWVCSFRYSAWEWNEERQQYYYHAFAIAQPELNYRNPKVVEAMKDVLKFWMDNDIDGFRIDAVAYLVERADLIDEPVVDSCPDPNDYCHTEHIYTKDQPESYEVIYQFREFVDAYKNEHNKETVLLLTEAYTGLDANMKFYGDGVRNGSHLPFNFEMINKLNKQSNAADFSKVIDSWLDRMPEGASANWVIGNHDQKRVSSRYGIGKRDLMNILVQTLPGVAITYYGEEIGMTDVYISWEDTVDVQACNSDPEHYEGYSRDTARTPFQWDSSPNSGFSNASKTWLPVANDYRQNNVEVQTKTPKSHLNIFRKLTEIRRSPSFEEGSFEKYTVGNDVLVYKREKKGSDKYIIVLNFGLRLQIVNLTSIFPDIGEKVEIVTSSIQSIFNMGESVPSNLIVVPPEVGAVFVSRV